MSAVIERLTPEKRLEIGRTRLTKPALRFGELAEMARSYGVSETLLQTIRREYGEENEVPAAPTGRIPDLPPEQLSELWRLLDLREIILSELTIGNLAQRFKTSRGTISRQAVRRRKARRAHREGTR